MRRRAEESLENTSGSLANLTRIPFEQQDREIQRQREELGRLERQQKRDMDEY